MNLHIALVACAELLTSLADNLTLVTPDFFTRRLEPPRHCTAIGYAASPYIKLPFRKISNPGSTMIRRSWARQRLLRRRLLVGCCRFGKLRRRIRPLFGQNGFEERPACFWKVCSAMSNARTVGCARSAVDPGPWRQQSILVQDWDAMPCVDSVRDMLSSLWQMTMRSSSSTRLAFLNQGKRRGRGANTPVRQANYETARIGVFATDVSGHGHAFIDRAFVSSEGMDRDPDRLDCHICPRHRLCDQTKLARQ